MKKITIKTLICSLVIILGIVIAFSVEGTEVLNQPQSTKNPKEQVAAIEATDKALNELVGFKKEKSKFILSEKELIVINQWAIDRKMEGLYFIDETGGLGYKEDALITRYREMSIEQLRDLLKKDKNYQLELVLVEKLLEQNILTFDSKNPSVVAEVNALVLDLTLQGNVSALQNLVDTYMQNGYKVAERNGKKLWLTDQASYKNAFKYLYILERRGNWGFDHYKKITVDSNSILTNLATYNQVVEQGRVEGEQLYQQLELARQQKGFPPFDNHIPNEVNTLYDYVTAPFREMEQELR